MPRKRKLMLGRDYVMRDGRAYYTSAYLATLGTCCNNQCTGCPWERLDPQEAAQQKVPCGIPQEANTVATASAS